MIVQEGVAIEVAEAVVGALKGELSATAVNAPMVPAEVHSLNIYQLSPSVVHISEGLKQKAWCSTLTKLSCPCRMAFIFLINL